MKSVRLVVALFSDSSWHGSHTAASELLRAREVWAEEVEPWITLLAEVEGVDPAAGRRLIEQRLATFADSEAGSGTRSTVRQLVSSPELNISAVMEARQVFTRQRELALRHRKK